MRAASEAKRGLWEAELAWKEGLEVASREFLTFHSGLGRSPGGTEHAGEMGPWAEITHQDPTLCMCGSWELRFVSATSTHCCLMLQDSLVFDTSRDALANTEMTEAAHGLKTEPQFVPMSGGLPEVKITSRMDGVLLCRSVLRSIWFAVAILRDCSPDV